jgi:hypothetical protein
MKNFLNNLFDICVAIGTARAATYLAQQGRHEEAKALMIK